MVHIWQYLEDGRGVRRLELFGIFNRYLQVTVALNNEHGQADTRRQLCRIERKRADQKILDHRMKQRQQRRRQGGHIDFLARGKLIYCIIGCPDQWPVRRVRAKL